MYSETDMYVIVIYIYIFTSRNILNLSKCISKLICDQFKIHEKIFIDPPNLEFDFFYYLFKDLMRKSLIQFKMV